MCRIIFHGHVVFSCFYVDLLNALALKLSGGGLQCIYVENIFVIFVVVYILSAFRLLMSKLSGVGHQPAPHPSIIHKRPLETDK